MLCMACISKSYSCARVGGWMDNGKEMESSRITLRANIKSKVYEHFHGNRDIINTFACYILYLNKI